MSHLLCSQDTRTHVVGELYDTERSYVESLQILVEVSFIISVVNYCARRSLLMLAVTGAAMYDDESRTSKRTPE